MSMQIQQALALPATRWECQCDSGGYIRTDDAEEAAAWIADGRTVCEWERRPLSIGPLAAHPSDEADMFWPVDDSETMYHSLDDAVNDEVNKAWPIDAGAELEFMCAARFSNVKVRITAITQDSQEWEIIPPSAPVSELVEA